MLERSEVDGLIKAVESNSDYRILRRLTINEGFTGIECDVEATSIGLVVDVETTGTDTADDAIIELAMRRFLYDQSGRIIKFERAWSWREDPGRPLSDEIVRLTGITDADLVGQAIDEDEVGRLLASTDLVIAHNADFDRKFVERRFSTFKGLPWSCSCREIDWAAAGFDGRGLGWLVAQAGWFFDAHRAENDVDAVIALLMHRMPDGRPALAELIGHSRRPTVRIEAVGADFGVKDALRTRGYRWKADAKIWWREVAAYDLLTEELWLAGHVYAEECRPRAFGPVVTEVTARERYA